MTGTAPVEVAIIGAGPYGLSLAAHLAAAGVPRRIHGQPMDFWRRHMPAGMLLKSPGFASNLSDPSGTHTLGAFCRSVPRRRPDNRTPIALDTFVEYGQWFQRCQVPELDPVDVADITAQDGGFELVLATGERTGARSVVVAVGLRHFSYLPAVLSGLPRDVMSHSTEHADLSSFRGREVLVIGAGQSALESAALLHEHGAQVRVMARTRRLAWNTEPLPDGRSLARRLREPEAALGSGWRTWFYSTHPALFRRLPANQRLHIARTALGPAGAWWLRTRIDGRVGVLLGHTPVAADPTARGVRVRARRSDGRVVDVVAEHVIAATGYRSELARLPFVGPSLLARIRTLAGAPLVNAQFESSVPGLYFVGPAVASSLGPAMRFVWGADFAARTLTRRNWIGSWVGVGSIVEAGMLIGCVRRVTAAAFV